MLSKLDMDMPINSYSDMHQSLVQCIQAKNMLSIRRGTHQKYLCLVKAHDYWDPSQAVKVTRH